jgi:hypothetical protein
MPNTLRSMPQLCRLNKRSGNLSRRSMGEVE